MPNKAIIQTRLESNFPFSLCGGSTIEVVNLSNNENKIAIKYLEYNKLIKGNNWFELLTKWEEENSKKS